MGFICGMDQMCRANKVIHIEEQASLNLGVQLLANLESASNGNRAVDRIPNQLYFSGVPFNVDKEHLGSKSRKIDVLLKEHPGEDLSHALRDAPADPETFELVARFCHGYEIHLTTENVIQVACLAQHLGMTESHCSNNLLNRALEFFENQVLTSWNKSIRALKSAEKILQPAVDLGLVGTCVDSIIEKALEHPNLLGKPVKNVASNAAVVDDDDEENGNVLRPNVRRKLFGLDWKSEVLSMLSIRLFEPIISTMIQRNVKAEYVCAAVCQYAKIWVFSSLKEGVEGSIFKRNIQREIIEAVERMLPNERGLLPSASLSEMLKSSIALEASNECRNGFEMRIVKQLDQATVEDLLIPSQGYAKEEKYDTECVKRILKNYYQNYTSSGDGHELISIAELVDNFLVEIATDIDLKMATFMSFAELSIAASEGIQRNSNGIYRAIDVYFDVHRYLTESEREEVCQVLDCNKLSGEACLHAAQNERLPLRGVVQVMFVMQLQMRETMPREVKGLNEKSMMKGREEEEETEGATRGSNSEEEVRVEMEKMGNKVLELERECNMMRRQIENGSFRKAKEGKVNIWKEMKRKFGCITSIHHDCNCHVKKKKVHPR